MAHRRKNGEGSIRQRKDGRWEGRFTAGFNADTGKPISKSVMGKTFEEVSEKLKKAISDSGKEYPERLTVADWMTIWFETYSKPAIRESTAISYHSQMRNHIFPGIGEISLINLTPLDIQKMYNETKSSGRIKRTGNEAELELSGQTIRNIHTLLKQCLEQAVRERRIPYNPVDACKLPPKKQAEMKVIPPEKIGNYLKVAESYKVLAMFFLALSSGLRRGELLALLWADLNVDNSTISITKQVAGRKGGLVISTPKTPNSIRTLAIPKQAVELLITEHSRHPNNPYMFPSPKTGKMYYPDSVGRLHKKILREAGIGEVRFHDLRHTFATLAIQNGVDIKTLSGMLGHYSAGFTLDTYAHVTDKMQREAANKMGRFMKGMVPTCDG
jgi:integrase